MSQATPQWPMVRQVYRRQELMDSMMRTAAVDVVAAVRQGQAFLEARSKCRVCPFEQECREWLATCRAGERSPEFCPNAPFFDVCRRRQG
jgi:hypothetical protein